MKTKRFEKLLLLIPFLIYFNISILHANKLFVGQIQDVYFIYKLDDFSVKKYQSVFVLQEDIDAISRRLEFICIEGSLAIMLRLGIEFIGDDYGRVLVRNSLNELKSSEYFWYLQKEDEVLWLPFNLVTGFLIDILDREILTVMVTDLGEKIDTDNLENKYVFLTKGLREILMLLPCYYASG